MRFQWRLAGLIILSSAIILLIFLFFGRQLLIQLKIDLASFKIGGGLILPQFGFSMLRGTAVEISREKDSELDDLKSKVIMRFRQIFIPIGVPVIAGQVPLPQSLFTVIRAIRCSHIFFLCLALLGVLAILFFTLITGPAIQKVTGELSLKGKSFPDGHYHRSGFYLFAGFVLTGLNTLSATCETSAPEMSKAHRREGQ